MILFIKNIGIEGPETIGDFFQQKGFSVQTLDLQQGDRLPGGLDGLRAVVVLGGPMNVYEEEKYPFLRDEDVFIKKVVAAGMPFLGICLGGQLLAKACGAKVTKNPIRELGFSEIRLTMEGKKDPLFKNVPERLTIYQWHEDTFAIPGTGHWLAKSPACAHQAFRVGTSAYGLQFHVEITEKSIRDWTNAYLSADNTTHQIIRQQMLASYGKLKESFHRNALVIYNNFLHIMENR